MKIATWNCRGKLDTKLPPLLGLGVDIAVLCEAKSPSTWPIARDGLSVHGLSKPIPGAGWRELVVVVASDRWTLSRHEAEETAPDWTLPVRVSGPASFTVVGINTAAFPGTGGPEGEIDRAIDWMQDVPDVGPILLAGDFNSPISTSQRRYDEVTQRLTDMGLCDVYRTARGLEPGEEPAEPTYYQSRLGEIRGFHIDHIWLPAEWADGAAVHVGDYDTWIASGISDHVPVVADLQIGY